MEMPKTENPKKWLMTIKITITKVILIPCRTTTNPQKFLPMLIITAIIIPHTILFKEKNRIMPTGETIMKKPQ